MNVPMDDNQNKVVDLNATLDALAALPPRDRVRHAMTLAAQLLEFAAYEMAHEQTPVYVAEMILMAARLDRRAQRIADSTQYEEARGM